MRKGLIVIAISFCVSIGLWSQQSQDRVVAVLDFVDFSRDSDNSSALAPVFADSLSLVLARSNFKVLDRKSVSAAFSKTGGDRFSALDRDTIIAFAIAQGADVVVTGFYADEGDSINAGIRAYDVISGRLAVSDLRQGETGLAVFDTIDDMAAAVSVKMRESLPPLTAAEIVIRQEKVTIQTNVVERVVELGKTVTVTVLSPMEGAELFDGQRPVGKIADGRADILVKEGTTAVITQKLDGWYDREDTIPLITAGQSYTLGQAFRRTVTELGFAVLTQAPVGLNASFKFYLIPDFFFVGADAGLFLISPTVIPAGDMPGLGEFRFDILAGSYVMPDTFAVRIAPFVGVAGDYFLTTTPVGIFGLMIGARIEFNHPTGKVFVEFRTPVILPFATSFDTEETSLPGSFHIGYGFKL